MNIAQKARQRDDQRITIERPTGAAKVTIATARPGIVIGKKGEDIERLQKN